jgi:hypothetical protein
VGKNRCNQIKEEPSEGLADKIKEDIEEGIRHRNEARESQISEPRTHSLHLIRPSFPTTLPKSIVNKNFLHKKLVQIAIRRKSLPFGKDPKGLGTHPQPGSKLHTRSLEAGLRVKLTLAPNLITLYNSLTPHTNRQKTLTTFHPDKSKRSLVLNENYLNDVNLTTKAVQLIDNSLVDLSGFSKKVLKTFTQANSNPEKCLPTFNSLNTAVHTLFGIDEYSLVRITRSTATDLDGLVLLKFETAKPGEMNLIDDENFTDELLHSVGSPGDDPSNIFIKKMIARPRYKSDMKVYLIPKDIHESLYVDGRMLERDIINGVVALEQPFYKTILCAFEYNEMLRSVYELIKQCETHERNSANVTGGEVKAIVGSN